MSGKGPEVGPPASKRLPYRFRSWLPRSTEGCGLATTGTQQLVACYAITVWVESGSSWHALVKETLHERLHERLHELPLRRGGLLSSRVRLEFSKELLACRYLGGRCSLWANALGESELYLLRTLRAAVVA